MRMACDPAAYAHLVLLHHAWSLANTAETLVKPKHCLHAEPAESAAYLAHSQNPGPQCRDDF